MAGPGVGPGHIDIAFWEGAEAPFLIPGCLFPLCRTSSCSGIDVRSDQRAESKSAGFSQTGLLSLAR